MTEKNYSTNCSRPRFIDGCPCFTYKLIGPDSLNQKAIKSMLSDTFSINDSDSLHVESGRPLSTLQLLSLLEEKLSSSGLLTGIIKRIGKDRIEADHKVTDATVGECNFVENFVIACQDFISAGNSFECKLRQIEIT